MRKFLLALLVPALLAQVPAHTNHLPHTSNGIVMYGGICYAAPASSHGPIYTWMSQRFDWIIGGGGPCTDIVPGPDPGDVHGAFPTQVYWSAYVDIAVNQPQFYTMQASALARGQKYEGMILHSNVDMQWDTSKYNFLYTDGFDHFEGLKPASQGVFTFDGTTTYTDVTTQSYDASANTTVSKTLYVGSQQAFDQINFAVATPRSGGSVTFKYWNGSWTTLTNHFLDATTGLQTSGKVSFYPPSDWVDATLATVTTPTAGTVTHAKHWVQIVVTGASTAPIYSTAKGDQWNCASGCASAGNTARGWAAADSNRINVGTLNEYNPTPPTNATAKFQYQSRVPVSIINYVLGNPSNLQGGKLTWGTFLQDAVDAQIVPPDNFDGAFMDDASRIPASAISPADSLSFMDFTQHVGHYGDGFTDEQTILYSQIIADLKTEHGANFWVNSNGILPIDYTVSPVGDASLIEGFITPASWFTFCTFTFAPYGCPYDDALTAHNANNTKWYFQSNDLWSVQAPWSPVFSSLYWSTWHYADNGNRTPMTVLAQNYLGANSNTGFIYNGGPERIDFYTELDQVFTYETATTLTGPVTSDTSTGGKTVPLASTANCSEGNLFRVGSTTFGDTVKGALGLSIYAVAGQAPITLLPTDATLDHLPGTDRTTQFRDITSSKPLSAFPFALYSGDVAKFGSLTLVLDPAKPTTYVTDLDIKYFNGTSFVPLTVTDTTNQFRQNGTITWTPPSDWALTSLTDETGTYSRYFIRIASYSVPNVLTFFSTEWKGIFTTDPIFNSYSSGASASCIKTQHMALITAPAASTVYAYTRWFPAQAVDLGVPNTGGLNGGARIIPWKTGLQISGQANPSTTCNTTPNCSDLWRRDYTNAIVLYRPWYGNTATIESELDTPSQPIDLGGGTYYRLASDGTTGAGITSIQLRGSEGAILMTTPGGIPPTYGLSIRGAVKR